MTYFGCGEIYSNSFLANCLLILTVKNFEHRLIFGSDSEKKLKIC